MASAKPDAIASMRALYAIVSVIVFAAATVPARAADEAVVEDKSESTPAAPAEAAADDRIDSQKIFNAIVKVKVVAVPNARSSD